MKPKIQTTPLYVLSTLKIAALFIALTGFAAISQAQIGGSGWSAEPVSFNVQWPYNVAEDTRYWFTNNIYHCQAFTNDAPFEEGSTTLPRTEQRFNPDYTNGEIQYQSMEMAPGNENSYCMFQIHTGDAYSDTYGSTTFMLFWFTNDGGSVHDYDGTTLATNLANTWFQLNVDHNMVTHTIKVWINSDLVWTQQDNGAPDFYLKDGVYEQVNQGGFAEPTLEMDTYVKDINIWTNSGFSDTYEIQNVTSGQALNNQGSTTNGSPISQWDWVDSPNLEWNFVPTSNGYYQIQSVKSGLDVVVAHAATTNNAPLIQWSFGSSGDDQWEPVENANGTWTFYNLHSGLTLNSGGSTMEGAQYSQWAWADSANEEFNLIEQ